MSTTADAPLAAAAAQAAGRPPREPAAAPALPLRAQARPDRRRRAQRRSAPSRRSPSRCWSARSSSACRPSETLGILVWLHRRARGRVLDHLGLPALPAAAHRHRGRVLEPPQAHRAHPAPADQRVRRAPHRRPRLARRHRHDAALRRAHPGPRRCGRQRPPLRRRARRDGAHRPGAARAHRRRDRRLGRRRGAASAAASAPRPPQQQEKVGELASGVERAVGSIRTVRASGATEREVASITETGDGGLRRRRADREGLGARRADRRHRAAGVAARRARRRRLPRRRRRDHDRLARDVHHVPVPAHRAARLVLRRDHLGQPGARRARPHPGGPRPADRDPGRRRDRRGDCAATARPRQPRRGDRVPRRALPLPRGRRRRPPRRETEALAALEAAHVDSVARSHCRRPPDALPDGSAVSSAASRSACRAARASRSSVPPARARARRSRSIERFYDPTGGAILLDGARRPDARPRRTARAARVRRAGCPDPRRHDRRQPATRLARGIRCRVRSGAARGEPRRRARAQPARPRGTGRRGRRHALGRRAPAARDRPRAARRAADPAARRVDVVARRRQRAAHARGDRRRRDRTARSS